MTERTEKQVEGAKRAAETRRGRAGPESQKRRMTELWSDPEWSEKRKSQMKGHPGYENQKRAARESASRTYEVTDPDDNKITVHNLSEFCREHGLNRGNICGRSGHRGWSQKGGVVTPVDQEFLANENTDRKSTRLNSSHRL